MSSKTILASTLSLVALLAMAGHAHGQTASLDPVSGTITLDPSLGSQRFDTSIAAGGDIDADSLGRDCAGEIADAPGLRLQYGAGGDTLRIIAISNADTSLVIRTPAGEWWCNDDAMGGLNPILSLTPAPEGDYIIWVGRVSSFWGNGDAEPVELSILSIEESAPASQYLPTSARLTLAPGFQPSEFHVSGYANGAVRPPAWDNRCGGSASELPTLHLEYQGQGSGLAIHAEAHEDLTLLVRTPAGDFVCNDELENTDFVSLDSAPAGQYDIWVGPQTDRARAALVPVRLTLSEF
ncbi:hypothetical protein [Maricaulis sp.]|uniref:hypothetical protein n=1 Tax=Maricaulis sp. TaxID=1486257 RepID=UPI0025C0ADEE|nr:hypothetical protein [Maricaulis sp.]